ncbi:hypothetical protein IHI24_000610 [Rickettsia endosymbiont of Cardiosporidium cionae]|nr:hypothetical protein IHI24_000610 [Rickettsia endosymbiont of Cardiosporidium cionae]
MASKLVSIIKSAIGIIDVNARATSNTITESITACLILVKSLAMSILWAVGGFIRFATRKKHDKFTVCQNETSCVSNISLKLNCLCLVNFSILASETSAAYKIIRPIIIIAILNVRNCIISVYTTAFIPPIVEYIVTNNAENTIDISGLIVVKYSNILPNALNCTAIIPTALIIIASEIVYLMPTPYILLIASAIDMLPRKSCILGTMKNANIINAR